MGVVNYSYFLFGIVILFASRLLDKLAYFKQPQYPIPGSRSAMSFIWGSIFFLVLINLFQNINMDYGLDFLILVPSVLIILAIITFWGESFVAPTKNYLAALGCGILIGTITLIISYFAFLSAGIPYISSYLELVPVLLGLLVGLIAGKLIFTFILQRRKPDWNTSLWHLNKLWDLVNHSSFLIAILIFAVIEGTLQLHSSSLSLIFSSF